MIKVYTASLTKHAQFWLDLRKTWPKEIIFTSSWPQICLEQGDVMTPGRACEVWIMDLSEIQASDAVLVYAGPNGEDTLRGALVEAGMGIALGKAVIVVGNSHSYGSWQWHPDVHHAADMDEVLAILYMVATHEEEE